MIEEPSKYFWWAKTSNKYVFTPFWWVILSAAIFLIPILRVWWWVFIPFFLSIELRNLYLWWVRWDFNWRSTKWITLRIIPQQEVEAPLKTMEDVFSVLYSPLYDTINWREMYFDGAYYPWMSWEIVSVEGNLHFYVYLQRAHRTVLESTLYSYFPGLEIYEVPDYVKAVPPDAPNEEWDVYGEDFVLGNSDFYPIKTYEKFFEPQGERISAEEKRIDSISSLLEAMSRLGSGEQVWLQFIIGSLIERSGLAEKANETVAKITHRQVEKKKNFIDSFIDIILGIFNSVFAIPVESKELDRKISPAKTESGEREMVITPGERETVMAIEDKMKKPLFVATIRGVYAAKRENWSASNRIIPRTYFSHFQSSSNYLRYSVLTRPKTHYVMRKKIPFLRKRRMLRNYTLRFPPHFPDLEKETSCLNTEELATIIHFPFKITGLTFPTVERVEHRKGGPPPNLPIE